MLNDEKNNEEVVEENTDEVIDEENTESAEETSTEETTDEEETNNEETENNDLNALRKSKDEIKKLTNEVDALKERLLRINAEYDNFRKRTAKEKEGIYTDACYDILKEIIPVMDNLERAATANGSVEDLKTGIEMTIKGLQNSFEKLGVEEIDASSTFDPNLHQAVMHVEDDNYDKNSVVEVFMKGYKRGDKVIRHSVVKVAN